MAGNSILLILSANFPIPYQVGIRMRNLVP